MKTKYRIPYSVILQARDFAENVYRERKNNNDKFLTGQELAADKKGFEVEFAHCYISSLPFPEFFKGKQVDDFDCLMDIKGERLKVDIKNSKDFLINKTQFERKNVDAYVFESLEFLDYSQDLIFLNIHGWIRKKDVRENSEIVRFSNGSEAFKVKKLNRAEDLCI